MFLKKLLTTIFILVICSCLGAIAVSAQKLTPEELVTKHLASIGTAEARGAIKTVINVGDAKAISRSSAVRDIEGVAQLASDGDKVLFALVFNSTSYPFEKAAFDGQKMTVALWNTGQRSALADFLVSQDIIFKQGLFGGVLSSAWPLLNLESKAPKLSYAGTKKIDDQLLHQLKYNPRKGGGNMQISLYFDAETFRHVRTEYYYTVSARMGDRPQSQVDGAVTNTGSSTINRYKLTEEFSDFQATNNVTLPHTYKLHLSVDAQRSLLADWVVNFKQVAFNQPIEAEAFNVAASK